MLTPPGMFSVVMPLWNKRPWVAATVASAIGQTWRDFELVIVDDGSTDGSLEALAQFDDPRIRILRQANAGPGAARNAGIRAARHEWVALLDADDIWLSDHLEELDEIRTRHPDAGLIGTSIVQSYRNDGFGVPARNERRIERIDYIEQVASGRWPVTTSSAALHKSAFEALGGFGDALCGQDGEYWARIALYRPVAVSTRVTSVYVLGTGGICDVVRSPCLGRDLKHWSEVHPSLALLNERHPEEALGRHAGPIERYVDRQFRWCVRGAARLGDIRTLRALRGLYVRPPPLGDRLILALARTPAPVARAAFSIGFRLKGLVRRARLARRPRGPSLSASYVQTESLHQVFE